MFQVVKFDRGPPSSPSPTGSPCAVWSWGCAKLIRHGTFQSFRVEQLNNADGHDAAPKLDFPSTPSDPTQPVQGEVQTTNPRSTTAEEVSALQQTLHHPAHSNGSSQQSKRPKRNVRSAYARDSPINSQGGVTSSSPDEVLPQDENGASTVHRSKDGEAAAAAAATAAAAADTAGPESPAVIDAEQHESKPNIQFHFTFSRFCI